MKSNLLILLILFFCINFLNISHAEDIKGSRSPYQNWDCAWKQHEFKDPGVRLLFQKCSSPKMYYELSVKDGWIEQHRPSDDVIFGSHRILRMFSKPAGQSIEDAIKINFIDKIKLQNKSEELQARKSCKVVKTTGFSLQGGKITLTIKPTGNYEKAIMKKLAKSPGDFGCGEYGQRQGLTYFEYHPLESKTKYAFVIYGFDEPLFDENSIEFIE